MLGTVIYWGLAGPGFRAPWVAECLGRENMGVRRIEAERSVRKGASKTALEGLSTVLKDKEGNTQ
jgi:hypothetical protein